MSDAAYSLYDVADWIPSHKRFDMGASNAGRTEWNNKQTNTCGLTSINRDGVPWSSNINSLTIFFS